MPETVVILKRVSKQSKNLGFKDSQGVHPPFLY